MVKKKETPAPENEPTLDMAVKDIVDRWPAAAPILAYYGLDLCCGGVHPLRMAAQAHGCDGDKILGELLQAVRGKS